MKVITPDDIRSALQEVGVTQGQIIYMHVDLAKVGAVSGTKSKDGFCSAYLDAIRDVIGPEGTVVMPTYTTQVARFDIDFIWEETPTLLGLLPEYLRTRHESLRSIHPLSSVTALGPAQEAICANNSTTNFGWNSPFHRMLEIGARVVTIGLPSGYLVGFAHQLEAMCGVPYVYNKLLKWVPIVKGKRVDKVFSATVRHLDLDIQYELGRHVRNLRKSGSVQSTRLGDSWVHATDYTTNFKMAADQLATDPFYLLAKPPEFTLGKIPFDGITAGRDGIASEKPDSKNWAGFYLYNAADPGGDEDDLMQSTQRGFERGR